MINQANLRLGADSERRNSKKFIDIFLKMALCDDLPIEIMSKILALVAAKKERADWSGKYWTDVPDANTTYLQRMARYTLVCKKWNGLLWQNHPREIRAIKASSPVVKLLHKIPFLSELEIVVCYSTVQRDLDIFIDSLLAQTAATSFADVLQHLKTFSLGIFFPLGNTFQNDSLKKIKAFFSNYPCNNDFDYGFLFGFEPEFASTGQLDDHQDATAHSIAALLVAPTARTREKSKCTLKRFVRFPEGMKLECTAPLLARVKFGMLRRLCSATRTLLAKTVHQQH